IPAQVPTTVVAWPRGDTPRLAGISSFGFSGTNAHVIVQEAPPGPPTSRAEAVIGVEAPEQPPQLLCLSARTPPALRALAAAYHPLLEGGDGRSLSQVCVSVRHTRSHFETRLAVVGRSSAEVTGKLAAFVAGRSATGVIESTRQALGDQPRVAFL